MKQLPQSMRCQVIHSIGPVQDESRPLRAETVPVPSPGSEEILIRVDFCGVCHTELDEIEGRTPPPRLPIIPGHQAVGQVVAEGPSCQAGLLGTRVGVAWIHSACGHCPRCQEGRENLCPEFRGCGRDANGGYAEFMTVPESFAHPLPNNLELESAAPLLCAGAVGLRAIRLCELENGQAVGLTGFGASGHLVLQMLQYLYPASDIYVFARNPEERAFARELGANWTGDTTDSPPSQPAAIIDTTPAWKPVMAGLAALQSGGRLVINAIAKEAGDIQELLGIHYQEHLWREKILRTVTNVTREDVRDCLRLGADIPLSPEVTVYPLEEANRALLDIRQGAQRGARVLRLSGA